MTEDEEDLYGEAASERPIYTFDDEYVTDFLRKNDFPKRAGLLCRQRDTASGAKEVALVLGTNKVEQSLLIRKEMPLIDRYLHSDSTANAREGANFYHLKLFDEDGNEEYSAVERKTTDDALAGYNLRQWQDVKQVDGESTLKRAEKGKDLLEELRRDVYDAYKAEPDPLSGENYHFGLSEGKVWYISSELYRESTVEVSTSVGVYDSAATHGAQARLQLSAGASGMIYFPGAAAGAKLRLKIKLAGEAGRFEFGKDTYRPRQAVTLNPVLRVFTLPVRWANRYAPYKTKHLTYADLPLPTIEVPAKSADETGTEGYSSKAFELDNVEVDLTIPESRCVRFAILPSPEDPITWARDQLEDTALPNEYFEQFASTSVISSDISVSIRAEITLDECQFID